MKLKIITINTWYGGILWDNLTEFLSKEQPDILNLQEAYDESDSFLEKRFRVVSELKKSLKLKYNFFSPVLLHVVDKGEFNQGNAIISKFPISKMQTIPYNAPYGKYNEDEFSDFSTFPRNLQHASIQVEDVILNVFNTHGIWGFDGKDNERRLNMAKLIIKAIKDLKNVILTGDFNVDQNTQTIKVVEGELRN